MNIDTDKLYSYKPKIIAILGGVILFNTLAYLCFQEAKNNSRSLIINHLLELSPQNATYFWWSLFVLFLGLSLLSWITIFALPFKKNKHIFLSSHSITVPKNSLFSSTQVEIPYKEILSLQLYQRKSQRTLLVTHAGGNFAISESMLLSKSVFNEIRELLVAEVHGLTQHSSGTLNSAP